MTYKQMYYELLETVAWYYKHALDHHIAEDILIEDGEDPEIVKSYSRGFSNGQKVVALELKALAEQQARLAEGEEIEDEEV